MYSLFICYIENGILYGFSVCFSYAKKDVLSFMYYKYYIRVKSIYIRLTYVYCIVIEFCAVLGFSGRLLVIEVEVYGRYTKYNVQIFIMCAKKGFYSSFPLRYMCST